MDKKIVQRKIEKGAVDDLVLLDDKDVNEEGVTKNLENRFNASSIYTFIGPVLISVNPYQEIPKLYSPGVVKSYQGRYAFELAPHVFGVAEAAYKSAVKTSRDQTILVSGDSGAGKTEAAKKCMEYLSAVSSSLKGVENVKAVKDSLLDSNPVLESFGNAKTNRNDNSSRFGKHMSIRLTWSGAIASGLISNYLLEKPRVVHQHPNERNFHIFYQLAAASHPSLQGNDATFFRYLSGPTGDGSAIKVKGINDANDYKDTVAAMQSVGISTDNKDNLLDLVAAVCWLGNIDFTKETSHGKGKPRSGSTMGISSEVPAQQAASLLGVDQSRLQRSLTYRTIITRGERVETPLGADDCIKVRDTLSKALYSRGFNRLVHLINDAISTDREFMAEFGLLDLYGFEIFDKNSFEQLCINYANEKLQQLFITLTLESEQREYEAEGIPWEAVDYFNNQVVVDLIERKSPAGVIAYLDEEALFPQATDDTLLKKLEKNLGSHNHFVTLTTQTNKHANAFQIKHFAGDVVYSVEGMLDKNKDTLFRDLIELGASSSSEFVVSLFPEAKENHDMARPVTAGSQFRNDMQSLIDKLMTTEPSYIRCIKPNDNKLPREWDEHRVLNQVRFLGLVENVKVRKAGYSFRMTYELFVKRFKMVTPKTWPFGSGDFKKDTREILQAMGITGGNGESYREGRTKIFIRKPVTLFSLEELRERKLHDVARMIQNVYRMYLARKKYLELREKAMQIFKGKKRRRGSWVLFFMGDYIRAQDSLELARVLEKNDDKLDVIFCDKVKMLPTSTKKTNKPAPYRVFLVTQSYVYVMVDEKRWKIMKKYPINELRSVHLSTYADGYVVMKFASQPPGPDLVFESVRKAEIITEISEHIKKTSRGSRELALQFSDTVTYTSKKKGLLASGVEEHTLTFKESSNVSEFAEIALPEKGQSSQDFTILVSPQLGSKAPMQLSDRTPSRAMAKMEDRAALREQDDDKKKGVGKLDVTRYDAGNAPKARALFEYKGTNKKDLSFKEGQVVVVKAKFADGWWEGDIDGMVGLFPSGYVEEI